VQHLSADFAAHLHLMFTATHRNHVEEVPNVVVALLIGEAANHRRVAAEAHPRPTEVLAIRIREDLALNAGNTELFGVVFAVQLLKDSAVESIDPDAKFIHHARPEHVSVADHRVASDRLEENSAEAGQRAATL